MATKHWYVDSENGDVFGTNDGESKGSAISTIQDLLDNATPSSDTNQINIIKRDTAYTLPGGGLDISRWPNTTTSNTIFRGCTYDNEPNDLASANGAAPYATLPKIDGADSGPLVDGTYDYVHFCDLHIADMSGMVFMSRYGSFVNCVLSGWANQLYTNGYSFFIGNHIFDCADKFEFYIGDKVVGNFYEDATGDGFTTRNRDAFFLGNRIIVADGSSNYGIKLPNYNSIAMNNSIIADPDGSKQGTGLYAYHASQIIANNLVQGFSGTGGIGIIIAGVVYTSYMVNHNAVYNCSTNYVNCDENDTEQVYWLGNNVNANGVLFRGGTLSYANRDTYFSPTPEVKRSSCFPTGFYRDRGAVEHKDPVLSSPIKQSLGY